MYKISVPAVSILFVISALAVMANYCLAPLFEMKSGPTRESFDAVEIGMRRSEVYRILGGPEGIYTQRPGSLFVHGAAFRYEWVGDEAIIEIHMPSPPNPSEEPRVTSKRYRMFEHTWQTEKSFEHCINVVLISPLCLIGLCVGTMNWRRYQRGMRHLNDSTVKS